MYRVVHLLVTGGSDGHAAHRAMESGENVGKLVLRVD
jgi:hypothetical protein